MKTRRLTSLLLTGSLLSIPVLGYAGRDDLNDSEWTTQGLKAIAAAEKLSANQRERARNVILFVGDGMGVSTLTAARILEGQNKGQPGRREQAVVRAVSILVAGQDLLGQPADVGLGADDDRDGHGREDQ